MVGRVIEKYIIGDTVPTEFAVLDHWLYALRAKFVARKLSVVAFDGYQNAPFVEISIQ